MGRLGTVLIIITLGAIWTWNPRAASAKGKPVSQNDSNRGLGWTVSKNFIISNHNVKFIILISRRKHSNDNRTMSNLTPMNRFTNIHEP